MIPEHLQDRYEEERSARASADPVDRDPDDRPDLDGILKPGDCQYEGKCEYPLCDCWLEEECCDD